MNSSSSSTVLLPGNPGRSTQVILYLTSLQHSGAVVSVVLDVGCASVVVLCAGVASCVVQRPLLVTQHTLRPPFYDILPPELQQTLLPVL